MKSPSLARTPSEPVQRALLVIERLRAGIVKLDGVCPDTFAELDSLAAELSQFDGDPALMDQMLVRLEARCDRMEERLAVMEAKVRVTEAEVLRLAGRLADRCPDANIIGRIRAALPARDLPLAAQVDQLDRVLTLLGDVVNDPCDGSAWPPSVGGFVHPASNTLH